MIVKVKQRKNLEIRQSINKLEQHLFKYKADQ
jgi:hypothetical protein